MKRNKKMVFYILLVTALGLVSVYSASRVWAEYRFDDAYYFVKRQLLFAILGIVVMVSASKLSLLKWRYMINIFYWGCILSLVLVLIFGVSRNGSKSWFGFGSLLVQPSEFFKIAMILKASDMLAKQTKIKKLKDLIPLMFYTLLGFGLIMLQPDFGSGMVMLCSVVVIVLAADGPFCYFVRLGILGLLGLGALILSAPYRLARITAFIDPWQDPLGSGFQMIQSLFAIAPGGLLGKGFDMSIQKHFYLPEPQTDFIFAIFAEEWGFIGGLFLIALYVMIVYEGVGIAKRCDDAFLAYAAMGFISLFAIQVLINLGVVVGLFPVTGITLPLFSYGGSSLVVILGALGLLIGISNEC